MVNPFLAKAPKSTWRCTDWVKIKLHPLKTSGWRRCLRYMGAGGGEDRHLPPFPHWVFGKKSKLKKVKKIKKTYQKLELFSKLFFLSWIQKSSATYSLNVNLQANTLPLPPKKSWQCPCSCIHRIESWVGQKASLEVEVKSKTAGNRTPIVHFRSLSWLSCHFKCLSTSAAMTTFPTVFLSLKWTYLYMPW